MNLEIRAAFESIMAEIRSRRIGWKIGKKRQWTNSVKEDIKVN